MESPARLGQLRLSLERKNELVPKESVRGLVKALDAMEREGVVDDQTKQWNVVHWGSKLKLGKASASGQSVVQNSQAATYELGGWEDIP